MSRGELTAACNLIGLAFADNPNTLAIVRGDRRRAQRMMQAAVRVAKLARTYSHVLVAERAGSLVGVLNAAEWPNCQLTTSEKVRTAPAMIGAMGSALPRAFKMMRVWAKHDPQRPHWHLGPIGVHPQTQGQGVGKAMLKSFLEMVDEQGASAYLETDVDRNVLLYEQFGFKVIGQEDMLHVNNRFMWRDAGAGSSR